MSVRGLPRPDARVPSLGAAPPTARGPPPHRGSARGGGRPPRSPHSQCLPHPAAGGLARAAGPAIPIAKASCTE
eukprot:14415937-Alexandrium_andersonii.AAC.1